MKIGILCADDREVVPFLDMIENPRVSEKAKLRFYEGTIAGVHIVTLFCGACKVNAAIAAQILIDTYGCDAVINAGTAGGMDEQVDILDTVICSEVAYHDVSEGLLTEYHPHMESIYFKADRKLLELAERVAKKIDTGHRIFFGRMVTGEQFIVQDKRDRINARFAPLSVDMETAGVAHVCYANQIPFIAVRTITDTEEHSGEEVFDQNCDRASKLSADIVKGILEAMQASLDSSREMYYYKRDTEI